MGVRPVYTQEMVTWGAYCIYMQEMVTGDSEIFKETMRAVLARKGMFPDQIQEVRRRMCFFSISVPFPMLAQDSRTSPMFPIFQSSLYASHNVCMFPLGGG